MEKLNASINRSNTTITISLLRFFRPTEMFFCDLLKKIVFFSFKGNFCVSYASNIILARFFQANRDVFL